MSEDLSFDKIIARLQEIHKEYPDLRFGKVMQVSMDEKTRVSNTNINDRSSKEILTSLDSFQIRVKKQKDKANKGKKGDK